MKSKILLIAAFLTFAVGAQAASTSIWNAPSVAPATGTMRIPVDTGASSGPGQINVGNIATYVSANLSTALITSSSANALTVGPAGLTNPAFKVDASAALAETGIQILSQAAGSSARLQVISSAANEAMSLDGKGTLGVSVRTSGVTRASFGAVNTNFTPGVSPTASSARFLYTGATDLTLTASTEAPSVYFNSGQTRQHATGALALQRDFRITGSTHSAVAASVITDAAAFSVDGPDSAGTNATITNSHGIYIPTAALTGTVTNAFALSVNAPTGASKNYAARFNGGMIYSVRVVTAAGAITVTPADYTIEVNKTTGAATVVNLPATPATGQIFIVKDGKGDAATNNITLTPAAGNIDNAATYVINTNKGFAVIQYDGTQWIIIGS